MKYIISHFQVSKDLQYERCHNNNFCHALWQEDKTANGTKIKILSQGIYHSTKFNYT